MKRMFNPNALQESPAKGEQKTLKFVLEKNEGLRAKFPVDSSSKFLIKFSSEEYRIPEEVLMRHTDFPVAANFEILDNLGSYWGFDKSLIEAYLLLLFGAEVEVKENNLVDFYIFVSCFQVFKTKQEVSEEIKQRLTNRTLEKTLKLWSFCEEFQDVLIFFVRAECMDTSKPDSMLTRLIRTYSGLEAPQNQVDTKFISEGLIESITQEMLSMSHVKTKSIIKVIRGFYKEEKEAEAKEKIKEIMSNRPPWRVMRDRTDFMSSFPDMHDKILHQEESLAVLKNLTRKNLDEIEKLKSLVKGITPSLLAMGPESPSFSRNSSSQMGAGKKMEEEKSPTGTTGIVEHESRIEAFIEKGKKGHLKPMTIEDQDGRILWTIDWHPSSDFFAVGDQKGGLKVYSVTTYQLEVYLPSLHTDVILSVAWSHDGRLIATAGGDKSIKFYNFHSRRIERDLIEYHQNWILSLAWSNSNRYIFSGSDDLSIKIYDYLTGTPAHSSLSHHERVAVSAIWSDDDKFLVSIGDEASICIFAFEKREITKKVKNFHPARINALAWFGETNTKIVTVACADEEVPFYFETTGTNEFLSFGLKRAGPKCAIELVPRTGNLA